MPESRRPGRGLVHNAGVARAKPGQEAKTRLTHLDARGAACMVDVGGKPTTRRHAVAEGCVRFGAEAFRLLTDRRLEKGDAIAVARLAGIQAGKRTQEWIPLCHQVPLDHLDVSIELDPASRTARVAAEADARWTTGVEMEAMVAVTAACLALYDMTKGIDRAVTIEQVRLLRKSGGRSGSWRRKADSA